jgi:putative ribosome biogenesis GTPase RsgA
MIDVKQYGYTEIETPPDGLLPGRVTEHRGAQYIVVTARGEVAANLKGAFYHEAEAREDFPCVGDFVLLQYNELGDSRIAKLLPRRSKFSRADFSGHAAGYVKTILEQVVATNFDYVFILSSLNWDFKVNCHHKTEPGCAVLSALADGSLLREHWERYLAQKRENKFVDDKSGYLQDSGYGTKTSLSGTNKKRKAEESENEQY